MISIGSFGRSPRRITAPLPNCRSICARAASRAFSRSVPAMGATRSVWFDRFTPRTLAPATDNRARGAVTHPPKELKAFRRVNIAAGATATVQLVVPAKDIA